MDTANDEAIARLLFQQDAGGAYYGAGGYMDNDDDSDYGEGPKKKKRARAPAKTKGMGGADAAAGDPVTAGHLDPASGAGPGPGSEGEDDGDEEEGGVRTETGRRKRKDVGKQRQAGRAWTDEEEALFLKAMELHGRDWKRASEVVATRDHRGIASHAQKYFIKMCLAGKPLPAKTAETGLGYTLSGSMLDPYSAAARSYGFKPELLQRLGPDELQVALAGLDLEKLPVMYGGRLPDGAAPPPKPTKRAASNGGAGDEKGKRGGGKKRKGGSDEYGDSSSDEYGDGSKAGGGGLPAPRPADPAAGATAAGAATAAAAPPAPGPANVNGGPSGSLAAAQTGGPEGPPAAAAAAAASAAPLTVAPPPAAAAALGPQKTEYARNRPKRELAGQRAQVGNTSESTQLVKCMQFQGVAGSGGPLAQPFSLDVSSWAMLTMDFHAHLSSYEVIGLLGGRWNAETKQLLVIEAYPCRRAEGSHAATSVELDPASQVEVMQEMEAKEQTCVGWYHSHPIFEPSPSQKDMDNQRNYQALFRDAATKLEPFVGVIVGPYDPVMPHPFSVVNTFIVQQSRAALVPYYVQYAQHGLDSVPNQEVLDKLSGMLAKFKDDAGRIDFTEQWRPYTSLQADGLRSGAPLTRIQKLRISLATYVREAPREQAQALLQFVTSQIQALWGQQLEAALTTAAPQQQQQEPQQQEHEGEAQVAPQRQEPPPAAGAAAGASGPRSEDPPHPPQLQQRSSPPPEGTNRQGQQERPACPPEGQHDELPSEAFAQAQEAILAKSPLAAPALVVGEEDDGAAAVVLQRRSPVAGAKSQQAVAGCEPGCGAGEAVGGEGGGVVGLLQDALA